MMSGRQIRNSDLKDIDALIVRSVTPVTASLLSGTPVRFVGTATIGVDHVDLEFLNANDIAFSSAPGCNARAVAEYVITAMLELEAARNFKLEDKTLGVIGAGNVGCCLKLLAEGLGMTVFACDPPLAAQGQGNLVNPDEAWACDIVSLHVPYSETGEDATRFLANYQRLSAMKSGATIINTSRGAVLDNRALSRVLEDRFDMAAVIDVWEDEPLINRELASRVDIATPHIAGYSYDGKIRGTFSIYSALCHWLKVNPSIEESDLLEDQGLLELDFSSLGSMDLLAVTDIVKKVYAIREDDLGLRTALQLPREQRGKAFDRLRKNYRIRREFPAVLLHNRYVLENLLSPKDIKRVLKLGFKWV